MAGCRPRGRVLAAIAGLLAPLGLPPKPSVLLALGRELVTVPSLPDIPEWEAFGAARQNLLPKLSFNSPVVRYSVIAAQPITTAGRT